MYWAGPNKVVFGARAKIAGLFLGVVEVNESPLGREHNNNLPRN